MVQKLVEKIPRKEKVEFLDINKINFEAIKQVKDLFQLTEKNFKQLRYLTI